MAPAAVAELVADAIAADRFWVFTDPHFTEMALDRWRRIAEGHNPQTEVDLPGFPPGKQLVAEIRAAASGPRRRVIAKKVLLELQLSGSGGVWAGEWSGSRRRREESSCGGERPGRQGAKTACTTAAKWLVSRP